MTMAIERLECEVTERLARWDAVDEEMRTLYRRRDASVHALLFEQIENYEQLVRSGGTYWNEWREEEWFVFGPLNERERIEFVRSHYTSHYAYIQLRALFDEARKKAASYFVRERRRLRQIEE